MTPPVITTERLVLRGHGIDDFAAVSALWADPLVVRYIGGRPFTGEEVWARLLRYRGHWELLGYGYWAACLRDGGGYVGELGFADLHRALAPALDAPELGWALAPAAHGRGLATEAVRAVLAWGDRHLPGARTTCIVHPANAPSLRVAAKAGFEEVARTTYHGDPTVVLARARGAVSGIEASRPPAPGAAR